MESSNCLLCGELGEVKVNKVTSFHVEEENISYETAGRLCKLLKLPYGDNATVLRGLTKCNICKECKKNIAKLDRLVVQLEPLKSKVEGVQQDFLRKLQPAQLSYYNQAIPTDPISVKTAEARQFLRSCLGVSTDEEVVPIRAENSATDQPREHDGFTSVEISDGDDVEDWKVKPLDIRAEASANRILQRQSETVLIQENCRGMSVKITEIGAEVKVEFVEEAVDDGGDAKENPLLNTGQEMEITEQHDQSADKQSTGGDRIGNSTHAVEQDSQSQGFLEYELPPVPPPHAELSFFYSKETTASISVEEMEMETTQNGETGDLEDCVEARVRVPSNIMDQAEVQVQVAGELIGFTVPMAGLGGDLMHLLGDHSSKKLHECELCDFSSNTSLRLERHRRIHAGAKPQVLQLEL